jgi:thiol-disulfide isomerase/thioredoxin
VSPGSRIALAAVLVVAAGPAGFFTYRILSAHHSLPEPGTRELVVQGSASTSSSEGSSPAEPAPPELLPDITLPDRQGVARKLSDWRGQPLLVNFWATWCEPCRREIPLLEKLRSDSNARLQVVGIAVDDRDPVLKYAQAMHIDYPVLVAGTDGGVKAIGAFGVAAVLPFTVFADGKGRIVSVKIGELHPDEAHFIVTRLLDVDANRLALATARDQISSGLKTFAQERAKRSAAP